LVLRWEEAKRRYADDVIYLVAIDIDVLVFISEARHP